MMNPFKVSTLACTISAACAVALAPTLAQGAPPGGVLPRLPASPTTTGSTVPQNGDLNPYGLFFVPPGFPAGGPLHPGDVITANFNNSAADGNLQGLGTTIVRVNPGADPTLFFHDAKAPGFTTALIALESGFVLVGNLPSTDGSGVCVPGPNGEEGNVGQGSLLVVDRHGRLVKKLVDHTFLDTPWDMTVADHGSTAQIFVSNERTGNVVRLDARVREDRGEGELVIEEATIIGSGYAHHCDPGALVVGPTGLALDPETGTLYVASTADNAIFAIRNATRTRFDHGRGRLITDDPVHLHGPVGLVRAANGDLISAQGDAQTVNPDPNQPSEIVEFTADGKFVSQFSIDPTPGSAFGLALVPLGRHGFRFAAVDDGINVVDVWDVP
jgi:DNA-binding beta-propeller fold protein YncE